jgi:hypothetical protein
MAKKDDLSKVTEEDLLDELKRRKVAREEAARAAKEKRDAAVVANIDALLALVPEHGRTSCSDQNVTNERRCNRCTLLYIKSSGWVDSDLDVEVSFTRRRTE